MTDTEVRGSIPSVEPSVSPTVLAPAEARRRPVVPIIGAVLVILALVLLTRLSAQDRGGPPHTEMSIGSGVPATLYLPGKLDNGQIPLPKPPGQRPPLVVVAHGYSADQRIMSSMARSLARAGYAAVTIDFRGHGDNTSMFKGDLRDDLRAVFDWAQTSPYIDGRRVVVLGHSMGASAALDFASSDTRPVAVIPISGGNAVNDARMPPHVLFISASGDPGFIRHRQADLATELHGKTDVQSVQIGGTDHATVVYSGKTIKAIVGFLDGVFGATPTDRVSTGSNDPRGGTAALYLLVALALVGFIGLIAGRTVKALATATGAGAWWLLIGATIVTMPLVAAGGYGFLPLGAGQPVAVQMALAGGILWGLRWCASRNLIGGPVAAWLGDGPWLPLRSVAITGVAAGVALFVLITPLGTVFHRLVPDPERLALWVVVAAMVLPFFAAFEAIVRRGSTLAATGWGILGRVVLLVALSVGVSLNVLPTVLGLVIPILVLQYVILEIFAATCYATGRNTAVIALVDSIFLAWLIVMLTPIG